MKGKLRLDITPIEGEFERRDVILQICKEAIEQWSGDSLTSGYVVRKHYREEGRALTGDKRRVPFLYLEAIEERFLQTTCPECEGTGKIDEQKNKEEG